MPHDLNGRLLKVGDTIIVECTVTNIVMGDEYCNLSAETKISMYPSNAKTTLTLNSKQVSLYGGNEVDTRDLITNQG